jgi:hypothetical protein
MDEPSLCTHSEYRLEESMELWTRPSDVHLDSEVFHPVKAGNFNAGKPAKRRSNSWLQSNPIS